MVLNYLQNVTLFLSNHEINESFTSIATYVFRKIRTYRTSKFSNKIFSKKLENYAIFSKTVLIRHIHEYTMYLLIFINSHFKN